MRAQGFDFLFSGEVLGQRPMSQTKPSLHYVEKHSGLKGYILRPLSAKLLAETIPEQNGQVDREKLLGISGRGRKDQIRLAESFGLTDYPAPAGGCLIAEKGFHRGLLLPQVPVELKWGVEEFLDEMLGSEISEVVVELLDGEGMPVAPVRGHGAEAAVELAATGGLDGEPAAGPHLVVGHPQAPIGMDVFLTEVGRFDHLVGLDSRIREGFSGLSCGPYIDMGSVNIPEGRSTRSSDHRICFRVLLLQDVPEERKLGLELNGYTEGRPWE
jgi:hypothetical protein